MWPAARDRVMHELQRGPTARLRVPVAGRRHPCRRAAQVQLAPPVAVGIAVQPVRRGHGSLRQAVWRNAGSVEQVVLRRQQWEDIAHSVRSLSGGASPTSASPTPSARRRDAGRWHQRLGRSQWRSGGPLRCCAHRDRQRQPRGRVYRAPPRTGLAGAPRRERQRATGFRSSAQDASRAEAARHVGRRCRGADGHPADPVITFVGRRRPGC